MKSAAESSERDAHNTSSSSGELTPESIRATLDKILSSPGFANADRLSRFLRYTVEETLNGQTDKLNNVNSGQTVTVQEGKGIVSSRAYGTATKKPAPAKVAKLSVERH